MSLENMMAPLIALMTALVSAFVGWRISRIGQQQTARQQAAATEADREHNVFADTEQALTGLNSLNQALRAETDRLTANVTALRADFDGEKRKHDVDSAAYGLIGQRCLTQSTFVIRALNELGAIVVNPEALAMLARARDQMTSHPHADPPNPT